MPDTERFVYCQAKSRNLGGLLSTRIYSLAADRTSGTMNHMGKKSRLSHVVELADLQA